MLVSTRTRGRPTVFDQDTVHKLEQLFSLGCTTDEACRISGVSRSAYYKKIETDHDFMDKMERSKLYAIFLARQTIVREIQAGNVKVAMWFLERKRRDEFGTCSRPHVSSNSYANFDNWTDEELLKIALPFVPTKSTISANE